MRLLIAGCGDLGTRLGRRWRDAGGDVVALRRRADRLPADFDTLSIDLSKPLPRAALSGTFDAVAYLASADQRSESAYLAAYVDGQRNLLHALANRPAAWVFASSTAVYGERQGGWVDERSPTEPERFNGAVLLRAEEQLRALLPTACCARLSGLYGPGRESMLRRSAAGEPGAQRWTNRIHIDDAASALEHLLRLGERPDVVCLSDDAPTLESDVLATLRHLQGTAPAPAVDNVSAGAQGRRVSNARLRALGIALRYADYRSGYAALLAQRQAEPALL